MIIINQERTKVINFEKITEITASGTKILVGDDIFIPKGEEIAKYETKERAKEVLQEIVSKYKVTLYNSKTNETVVNVPKVYEMPIK